MSLDCNTDGKIKQVDINDLDNILEKKNKE